MVDPPSADLAKAMDCTATLTCLSRIVRRFPYPYLISTLDLWALFKSNFQIVLTRPEEFFGLEDLTSTVVLYSTVQQYLVLAILVR